MPRSRGFTLLEVLIAMAIFAMLGLASNQMLRSVSNTERQTKQATIDYVALLRFNQILDRDFSSMIYRGVRDEFGDPMPAISVNQGLYPVELTRSGWRNPLNLPRSELQRVAYQFDGASIKRFFWLVLDRAEDSEPKVQTLLTGIRDFQVVLIKADGSRHEVVSADDGDDLPIAIELTITTTQYETLTRYIDFPTYLPMLPGGTTTPPNADELEADEQAPTPEPAEPSEQDRGVSAGRELRRRVP